MNGTANPDFSQVESDAGQFSFDPRQALFFPEKRPFFRKGRGADRGREDHRQGQRSDQPRLPVGGR